MVFTIVIDGWKRNIRFSAAHCILGHETCGRLHGHSYAISAKVIGEQQSNGMIMDFSEVSKVLKKIADHLDHRTLIPKENEVVQVNKDTVVLTTECKTYYQFPIEDCVLLPMKQVTSEQLAKYVLQQLQSMLIIPSTVHQLEISIDEGYGYSASLTVQDL